MYYENDLIAVVYHYNPTSNRNCKNGLRLDADVVYHYNPTSNRNDENGINIR